MCFRVLSEGIPKIYCSSSTDSWELFPASCKPLLMFICSISILVLLISHLRTQSNNSSYIQRQCLLDFHPGSCVVVFLTQREDKRQGFRLGMDSVGQCFIHILGLLLLWLNTVLPKATWREPLFGIYFHITVNHWRKVDRNWNRAGTRR